MPKSKLNEHFRWLIVEKILEGVPHRRIAEQLNLSKSSISRIFLNFKRYGCVEDLPQLGGRSRFLSADDIKYLENLLKEKIDWYLWELQSEMELWLGRHISYGTLWRAIHRLGYTHKQVDFFISFSTDKKYRFTCTPSPKTPSIMVRKCSSIIS